MKCKYQLECFKRCFMYQNMNNRKSNQNRITNDYNINLLKIFYDFFNFFIT